MRGPPEGFCQWLIEDVAADDSLHVQRGSLRVCIAVPGLIDDDCLGSIDWYLLQKATIKQVRLLTCGFW